MKKYGFARTRALQRSKSGQTGSGQFGHAEGAVPLLNDCLTKCTPSVAMTLVLPQPGTVKLHAPVLPQLQTAKIVEHGRLPPAKDLEALFGQGFIAIGHI